MPKGYPGSAKCGTAAKYYARPGCRCELCKEAYREDRKLRLAAITGYSKVTRIRRLKIMEERKGVPCVDCGQCYPPYVMDFHHRDPKEKLFAISQFGGCNRALFLAEIEKCDVICSNCHRIRTFKDKSYSYLKDEQ